MKIHKLKKIKAKNNKLKKRLAIGKRYIELKLEQKTLKSNIHYLKNYRLTQSLTKLKNSLPTLSELPFHQTNYSSLMKGGINKKMDTTNDFITLEDLNTTAKAEQLEAPADEFNQSKQQFNKKEGSFLDLEMNLPELPESDFCLDLPF